MKLNPTIAAEIYFRRNCATCHGVDGKGDGSLGKGLHPKPRDFSDPKWQASVSDEYIKSVIVKGGSVIKPKPIVAMPEHLDLESKPDVLNKLVKIIRAFNRG